MKPSYIHDVRLFWMQGQPVLRHPCPDHRQGRIGFLSRTTEDDKVIRYRTIWKPASAAQFARE